MFAAGSDIVSFIEELAPPEWALEGDASGLQWGDLRREAEAVLVTLDFPRKCWKKRCSLVPHLFFPIILIYTGR